MQLSETKGKNVVDHNGVWPHPVPLLHFLTKWAKSKADTDEVAVFRARLKNYDRGEWDRNEVGLKTLRKPII